MKNSVHPAILYGPTGLLSLAAVVLDATLQWTGAYHPSTQAQVAMLPLVIAIGQAVSYWLHANENAKAAASAEVTDSK